MIKRLTLVDFMAHARTVFELAPGLNVLTGPNNTGKSAVVEALRCLAENPPPSHVIRHGATEARVEVELDDGTVVAWVRRPKYALYELTRPGAAEPEVYAKFGRTPPEDILAVLALNLVPLEGGEVVDVHIGNQRQPVFLLDRPGSVVAGFFAASTEAAHLIAMQNLLTDRTRKAKIEKGRLEKRLVGIAAEIDRLSSLPDLELRLGSAAGLEADLAAREGEARNLADRLAADAGLRGRIAGQWRVKKALDILAAPPSLSPTAPLAEAVAREAMLSESFRLATYRREALARLTGPPVPADTATLARQALALAEARAAFSRKSRKTAALAPLTDPPIPADVAALAALASDIAGCRATTAGLVRKSRALSRLSPAPQPADVRPLADLTCALATARAAVEAGRAAAERKARELAALTARITARLGELGLCPLCGAALSTAEFLGDRHIHNSTAKAP